MTRPLAILAVIVLFVNDHFLKRAWPGFVTGKLSDVAGMLFFPLLLTSLVWTFVPRARRDDRTFDRLLFAACVATAIVFAATKTIGVANDAYRVTWGLMQWPLYATRALVQGRALPGVVRVVLVRDPSDLLAVPVVALAWFAGRRSDRTLLRRPDMSGEGSTVAPLGTHRADPYNIHRPRRALAVSVRIT